MENFTMGCFDITTNVGWGGKITEKVVAVMRMFGVDLERLKENPVNGRCAVELRRGDICYITGASGAGKSLMLNDFYSKVPADSRIRLDEIPLEKDRSLIDCIEGDFFSAIRTLSKAGLSDVFAVLNRPANLSEGQKYRYRLARALASGKEYIFADEFCSNLDRISAAVISHTIRKIADTKKTTFILASSHDDLLVDLMPDVVVIKYLNGRTETIYKDHKRKT